MAENFRKSTKVHELEGAVATQRFGSLALSPQADSVAFATFFLRNVKGRSDLSQALLRAAPSTNDFFVCLEEIRTCIAQGKIDRAQSLIDGAVAPDPEAEVELLLERARCRVFKRDFAKAVQLCQRGLDSGITPPWTRMTFYQVMGHAQVSLDKTAEAVEPLQAAVALASLYPFASSAVSARRFLIKAYIQLGQVESARRELDSLLNQLSNWKGKSFWVDRLLTVLRAESEFERLCGSRQKAAGILMEGIELSRWLGDAITDSLCRRELAELGVSSTERPSTFRKQGWSFLERFELVLIEEPKRFSVLDDSPISRALVIALLDQPLSKAELFEKIWKIRFDKQRHGQHIRMAVSNLRKILPSSAVVMKDGLVTLC